MRVIRAIVTVAVLATVLAAGTVSAGARAVESGRQRFCVPTAVIVDDIQKPVLQITAQRAPVLAVTLKHTAKVAPRAVARAMRDMASMYTALGHAATDADRSKAAFAGAKKFSAAVGVVVGYYSTHCVTPPVQSPNLPGVSAANQAACLADAQALQIAETEYSTLNGGFGTMDQLVGARLLRAASAMHPAITVGSPPGGYTIVGGSGCANLPVVG